MPFDSTQTPRDPRDRARQSPYAPPNRGGTGNPRTANNMPQNNDPYNQYGNSAQSPQLGRYVPPMLQNRDDLNSWGQSGGYSYNTPNSYGNPQYNQFNSTGMPNQDFGQYRPPRPSFAQLDPQQQQTLTMFSGLPGMSSITAPYRDQMRPPVPQTPPTTQPSVQMSPMGGQAKPLGQPGAEYMQGPPGKNRFTDWLRGEVSDRNGMPWQGEAPPTLGGGGFLGSMFGGMFNRGGGQATGAQGFEPPTYSLSGDMALPPRVQPFFGNSGTPNLSAGGRPAQPGYTPYQPGFAPGGPGSSGLGPTPGGGSAPRLPRSTRGATGYRLNAAMQGINALRDNQALEDMGLRNYGALRQ